MPRTSVKRQRREEQEELLAAERSGSGSDLDSSGGNAVSSASGPARNQVRNSSLLPSHFTALGRLTYLGTRHSCQSELLVSIATADVKQPRLTSSGTLRCSKNHSPFNLPTFSLSSSRVSHANPYSANTGLVDRRRQRRQARPRPFRCRFSGSPVWLGKSIDPTHSLIRCPAARNFTFHSSFLPLPFVYGCLHILRAENYSSTTSGDGSFCLCQHLSGDMRQAGTRQVSV